MLLFKGYEGSDAALIQSSVTLTKTCDTASERGGSMIHNLGTNMSDQLSVAA